MSFEAIYRRYHQDLYRYCLAIVGNPEDAQDALQNTMVKAMRALQGEKRQIKLKPWLYRIAHNESVDLLRRRRPTDEIDAELVAAGPGTAETAEVRERLRRLIADLEELPDRQRAALVMRELAGLSFEQIGVAFDTSPAVARQTVYEARVGLQQMSEGREMPCEEVCRALSDGDGRTIRRRDIRAHLRACLACRAFRDGVAERRRDLAALAPLPAVASAGLLHGILGGSQGSSGAGLAGAVGGGAGKAVATSAIVKSVATVAVVAAVGVSAADRGGLIHVGLPGSGGGKTAHSSRAAGATGPGVEPTAPPVQAASNPGGAQARAKAHRRASHGAGAASGGERHSHGANAATTPVPQASSGTRHGKGQAGKGHRNGPPAASGNGQQAAAAHGGRTQSPSHGHRHPASTSHPSPPAPPPNSSGTGPPPNPSPPAGHGPTSQQG